MAKKKRKEKQKLKRVVWGWKWDEMKGKNRSGGRAKREED